MPDQSARVIICCYLSPQSLAHVQHAFPAPHCVRSASTWRERFGYVFGGPGWTPDHRVDRRELERDSGLILDDGTQGIPQMADTKVEVRP